MPYDYQRGNPRGNGQPGGRGPAPQGSFNNRPSAPPAPPKPIEARPIPANYVDEAERVISELKAAGNGRIRVTTTKLRGFLTLVTDIYKNLFS